MDAPEVRPFVQWWGDWCLSLRSKPWRIVVSNIPYEEENARFEAGHEDSRDHRCIVDEPLKRDAPFSIWLRPQGKGREERPFCLIYEKLTAESALQLTTASLVIKAALQVDIVESFCVMAHIFVALETWAKEEIGKQEGRHIPSILTFGLAKYSELEFASANSDFNPGYPLQELLWHWSTEGAKYIASLRSIKEHIHDKYTGFITYKTIPPRIVGVPKLPSDQRPSDTDVIVESIRSLTEKVDELNSTLRQTEAPLVTKEAEATKSLLPPIKASSWDEVQITFVSNESIRIQAGDLDKPFSYAELGFKDGRKVDTPDTRWRTLQKLAQHGEISWKTDTDQKIRNIAQKAIQDIRKKLKEITGLEDDPFEPYRKVKAYRPKFKLVDKRYGGTGILIDRKNNEESEEDDTDPEIQAIMDEDIDR